MEVGWYYREMDSRFVRYVQVEGILRSKGWVYIRTVGGKKRTRANINRFDGRSGGYRFISTRYCNPTGLMLCDLTGLWKSSNKKNLVRVEDCMGAPLPDAYDDAIFSVVKMVRVSGGKIEDFEGVQFDSVMPKHNFHIQVVRMVGGEPGVVEVILSLNRNEQ